MSLLFSWTQHCFFFSSMSPALLSYSSSPRRSSSLPFILHPHFINPSLTSLFALVPPSTSLSPLYFLSPPPPHTLPSLRPLEAELSINSRTMWWEKKERERKEEKSLHCATPFLHFLGTDVDACCRAGSHPQSAHHGSQYYKELSLIPHPLPLKAVCTIALLF